MIFAHLRAKEVESIAQGQPPPPHLSSCPKCAARVARARARRRLLDSLPPVSLGDEALDRVGRKLWAAQAARKPSRSMTGWGLGLALATATVAVFVLYWPRPESGPAGAGAPALSPSFATAILLQGEVEWRGGPTSAWQPLLAGDRLSEGAFLRALGKAALSMEDGQRLLLEDGTLALLRARQGASEVRLDSGRVTCSLGPPSVPESFAVAAGPRRVTASDASFAVSRFASEVVVEAIRGVVSVSGGPRGREWVTLSAPGRLRLPDSASLGGAVGDRLSEEEVRELSSRERRVPAAEVASAVRLELDGFADGALLQVDDLEWGPVPLSGLFSPGPHRVRTQSVGQPVQETWLALAAGGSVRRMWSELESKPKPESPNPAAVAALDSALRRHLPQLRGCYERWLKKDLRAAGKVLLTLELSEGGQVLSARADGALVPKAAAACFAEAARSWKLPALGARWEVEVPLVLTAE
ncbi:MAG: FecR domain-containing protein [Myxococcales bacterium]|nr:FecR domain-containing protein [Myxococcales bacterium]